MWHQGQYFPRNVKKYKGDARKIFYRSGWEKKFMQHLDMNPNVIEWSSEELAIPYLIPEKNEIHRYFPDFIVKLRLKTGRTKTYMYEIKPRAETMEPRKGKRTTRKYLEESAKWRINSLKWEAASAFCSKMGWDFAILTEKDLGV